MTNPFDKIFGTGSQFYKIFGPGGQVDKIFGNGGQFEKIFGLNQKLEIRIRLTPERIADLQAGKPLRYETDNAGITLTPNP